MQNKLPEILVVELSNGDAALFVNGHTVMTKEHWERGERTPIDVGETLSRALNTTQKIVQMDQPSDPEWQWADVYELVPSDPDVVVKPFETREITRFTLLHDGNNSAGYSAEATRTGDTGIYEEVRISIFHGDNCVADLLGGLTERGEPRFLVTIDGNGDGDKRLAIYPMRDEIDAVGICEA